MAHVGQEFALGAAGRLGRLFGLEQSRLRPVMSRNVTTAPTASPSLRMGYAQYSAGKLEPSARQKTSPSE
jgi:hypothetical protein